MPDRIEDPFQLTAAQIGSLLRSDRSFLPELDDARTRIDAIREAPSTQTILAQTAPLMTDIESLPQTRYTDYRLFRETGDRVTYQAPYHRKRGQLTAASIRLFLGETELKPAVQDRIWNICEETDWVVPAHEGHNLVDLMAAETGFTLAQCLHLLGDTLDAEVRTRVRQEVDRRIFTPFIRAHWAHEWYYHGHGNWNGVCNGSIGSTFLLLEPEPGRVAMALELVLAGLRTYLSSAFADDGSSSEGVHCWRYGLQNFVALSEMLRSRSDGAIDLLASEKVRRVAAFPARVQLTSTQFATFSDSEEVIDFDAGIITRLAERTGDDSLPGVLGNARNMRGLDDIWRLPMQLRNILWWDGMAREMNAPEDAELPSGEIARMSARTEAGAPIVFLIKAGHNAQNHNQNDVGSFILHVDGETMLTDPGRGHFTRQYFSGGRYDNIFANSYGHSVPRVGGHLQAPGRNFHGEFHGIEIGSDPEPNKRVAIDIAGTYPVEGLESIRREVTLASGGSQLGTLWLHDAIRFAREPLEVEEALVTWKEVTLDGATAVIHGGRHDLRITIDEPAGLAFTVERLEEESRINQKPGILKRLSYVLPVAYSVETRMRVDIRPTTPSA